MVSPRISALIVSPRTQLEHSHHFSLLTKQGQMISKRHQSVSSEHQPSTMQDAITNNALAILRMEKYDYEGAFNLFRCSMINLLNSGSDDDDDNTKVTSPMTTDEDADVELASTQNNRENERFYSGAFAFYPSLDGPKFGRCSHRQLSYCTATCLFNMALACHLQYEQTTDCAKRTQLLNHARFLYLTAYQQLQSYQIERRDSILLLLMALLANLVDLAMEHGSVDEIKFWKILLEVTSLATDPICFVGSAVYEFFDDTYIAPGEIVAARAA